MGKCLTRADILNANDIQKERVNTPEWGKDGYVFVKALTARERDRWEASLYETKGRGTNVEIVSKRDDMRARLAAITICDETGQKMFEVADIDALSQKSAKPIDRIFAVAQRLSGITKEDVEELEKNLMPGKDDSSITN